MGGETDPVIGEAILREVRQRMISEGGLVNDLDTMFDRILM